MIKPRTQTHRRQRREQELAMFIPQKAAQADPDTWVDHLTNAEFGQMLGPSWAAMTERQRRLYPDLPADEMDRLWGESSREDRDAA